MKKLSLLLSLALVMTLSAVLTSCDDNNHDWYPVDEFNLTDAMNAYLDRYGEFGTDDATTQQWFSSNYSRYGGYYDEFYDEDYNAFYQELLKYYEQNQVTMAQILSTGAWQGNMTLHWKADGATTYSSATCTAEYDFDLSATGAKGGRGQEHRWNFSDDSEESTTQFTWSVDGYGNIILDFDSDEGQGKGIEMIVYYSDLDILSDDTNEFTGTMTSNTDGLDEYDDFSFTRVTYAKGALGQQTASTGKSFAGKGIAEKRAVTIKKISTLTGSHR